MSWKFSISRATTLVLALALCLGLMQFAMAENGVEVIEPEPRDMTEDTLAHSVHIEYCVS